MVWVKFISFKTQLSIDNVCIFWIEIWCLAEARGANSLKTLNKIKAAPQILRYYSWVKIYVDSYRKFNSRTEPLPSWKAAKK